MYTLLIKIIFNKRVKFVFFTYFSTLICCVAKEINYCQCSWVHVHCNNQDTV